MFILNNFNPRIKLLLVEVEDAEKLVLLLLPSELNQFSFSKFIIEGFSARTCLVHSCKLQQERKSHKMLTKIRQTFENSTKLLVVSNRVNS